MPQLSYLAKNIFCFLNFFSTLLPLCQLKTSLSPLLKMTKTVYFRFTCLPVCFITIHLWAFSKNDRPLSFLAVHFSQNPKWTLKKLIWCMRIPYNKLYSLFKCDNRKYKLYFGVISWLKRSSWFSRCLSTTFLCFARLRICVYHSNREAKSSIYSQFSEQKFINNKRLISKILFWHISIHG